ncbi:MAG: hypothetical protein VX463_08950 [Pseudomonadota bacterium]|nr:hypothetical protein [Pseudomonadota bacterium]
MTPGETVKLTAFGSGGATAKVVWLTPEGAFHSYEDRHLGVDVNYSREDIVVPEGVGFGLFTSNTTTPPVVERIGFAPITYDEAVALAAPAILLGPALNFWQDKKIVHFGTSIPEGSGANSYPPKYGAILGATVVNQAKASSMIALGVGAAATATDPYGWTGTKYIHARKSLARSNAEAQDMIDNWGDWKTLLQGAPSSLDETAEGVILGTTYEALLDPHLGDTDLFVFDHGYNDVAALKTNSAVSLDGSQVLQVPGVDVLVDGAGDSVDRLDRRWFLGANEFLFNRILEADPRARIAIVGHYEDQRTPLASQAQEALHARWRFPLVRLWERTGWSEQEVDVGGVMTPMINVWCPDGTHPHSDAAGRSTDLLATIIAEQIRQIR